MSSVTWPLFTIDFEASSLDSGTYPIEVGVCRWTAQDRCIEGWATLIRPAEAWQARGSWSLASQEIHRIMPAELECGMEPADAVLALNSIIGTHVAYCDGGEHDVRWARMLIRAAGTQPTFLLGDFDHFAQQCDQFGYMRLVRWLDRAPARHRARADAERLMKALARGLGVEHGTSQDILIDPASPTP